MIKHKLLAISLLPIAFSLLAGCNNKTGDILTYGTYVNQSYQTLEELTNDELYEKAFNQNEAFLLAVYQGTVSESCTCWSTYLDVVINYMNKYHEKVYFFNAHEQEDNIKELKITKINDDSVPYLYIFKGIKKLASFSYNNKKDNNVFSDTSGQAMYSRVHNYIKKPSLYYVDETNLDSKIKENEAMVLYMRKSCGDCKYVLPHVIIPYVESHNLKKDIYLFDMQSYYDLSKDETATIEEKEQYQNLKNKYKLSASSNEKFGYLDGVVPTAHYYKDNELKGAAVYFNDVVSVKEDGTPYVSDSFYSFERMNNLTYLVDYHDKCIFKDMEIAGQTVQLPSGDQYWLQEKAAAYYTPIWNKFLDYYLK